MTNDEVKKLFIKAVQEYNNNNFDEAINKFVEVSSIIINNRINDMNNTNIESIENIGVCYSKLGKHEEAIKQFEKALIFIEKEEKKQLNEKEKENLELIKISTYTNKISSLFKLKLYEDIISFASELLKKLENISYCDKNKVISDFYTYKGIAECYLKNYDNAIKSYHQAIKFNPYNINAYNNMSIIYKDKNNQKEAEKYCIMGNKLDYSIEFKIYIQSLYTNPFGLIIRTNYQCIIFDFISIFLSYNNYSGQLAYIGKMTTELKDKVIEFKNKYIDKYNVRNEINDELIKFSNNFRNIPIDEYFCILFGKEKISTEEFCKIMIYLKNREGKEKDIEFVALCFENIFSSTMMLYDIIIDKNEYNKSHSKKRVGDEKKCKYCNKKESNISNKSHIIPKSLGGNIIDEEECEYCNHKFGSNSNIEFDLGKYLSPLKTIYRIEGYSNIPQFKSNDGYIIASNKNLKISSQNIEYNGDKLESISFNIGKINMQNVYRAFVKMAMGFIERKKIRKNFIKTINWINKKPINKNRPAFGTYLSYKKNINKSIRKKTKIKRLPPIIISFNKNANIKDKNSAFITLFMRKDSTTKKLPYLVSEFIFYNYSFTYIIPFSNKDRINFANMNYFKKFYKQWHTYKVKHKIENFNDIKKNTTFTLNSDLLDLISDDIIIE